MKMDERIYIAGETYTTGGAAMHRFGQILSGCTCAESGTPTSGVQQNLRDGEKNLPEHLQNDSSPQHLQEDSLAEQRTYFTFKGVRKALILQGNGREFGGDRLLDKIANIYDIEMRGPERPYGKLMYLLHPASRQIVDVERDVCEELVEYEVHVEPKDDDHVWNLMPVLGRLLTLEYASQTPLPRQTE
mmetsp:Transcript_103589/g.167083  ORF Transcript_103589/g.167083 Transcript_103589/m.167083 type:complete len:188 (+) Transcript_103589:44-607(+)